ncbi:unnamed protein product [Mortierella alpina]
MPANYLQTKAGRKIKPGGPAAPKGKARAASARSTHSGSRRGSVRSTRSSQASHVPVRNLRAITTYKHQLEKVFQTSSLSVGSWKAKLRYANGPAGTLNDQDRSLLANKTNNVVTALNSIRSYMLQAIPLYISMRIPGHTTNSVADLAYRQQWLDPLVNSDDMLVICDNLSSLLAGSSQMMTGKRPHGPRPGRHAKVRITDEGASVVSASSSRSASPAPLVAAGVGPAAAGVGAAAAGVGPAASMHSVAAGGVGSSASSIAAGADPRKVIAWDMYNYLVQELQHRPVIGAKEYMPEATSRREMSRAVRDLVREHFTQLFPILNDKATRCNSNPEVGLDATNINTADLVWRFWSMNARLPALERIAFTPQARLVDTFMVFSETSVA